MPVVVVSPSNVAGFPDGGGHLWVYMQYIQGLRQLGCEVYWLERFEGQGDPACDQEVRACFHDRMEKYGMAGKTILYTPELDYLDLPGRQAEAILRSADLLLNFHYSIHPDMLALFRRTALVDIDPGLLQFWISTGQLQVAPHDHYLTIGETVGTPAALFPDCGVGWIHIRPPVCLELWPYSGAPSSDAFTTVSSWWGDEWITDGRSVYENNKRVSFMEFASLACLTEQPLELAIYHGEGDSEDLRLLKRNGWRIRHSTEVAGTPESYRAYLQASRGEFSCAKPSCMKFQNAWISDRTLCYLASGKPAVVQDTGPSSFLPEGEGLFRFSDMEEAVAAFATINADYDRHSRAAREIAETCFESKAVMKHILETILQ
jgi:hypothetical protein